MLGVLDAERFSARAPSRHVRFTPKATGARLPRNVRFVPCVDGSELARPFFTFAGWSVQPCVRPVCAVHMTAGHNALPRIRSRSKARNRDALAQVGCPDRRIDRLCITCCWASQPSHHAGCRRDRSRRECDGFLVAITSGHHGPRHSCDLVEDADRNDLCRPPRQQCGVPGPMFGAMDLGIADDGQRARREQAAQIAISLFADTAELVLAPARALLWHEPNPGRKIPPRSESLRISDGGDQSGSERGTNAGSLIQPLARLIGSVPGHDLTVKIENLYR